jgi:hypothetical protein
VLAWGGADPGARSESRAQQSDYQDPAGRFTFSYPQTFGTTATGTDNGFGNRVAAVRFAVFSTLGIGGEAVLTQGPPSIDVLAVGGLYDDIASGTLPPAIKSAVTGVLPALTLANFCDQLARERHIDSTSPAFSSLTAAQRSALDGLDRMGNTAPRVTRCDVKGDIVVFDKEASLGAGGPARRVYGAVRFLSGRLSTFQLVRAAGAADAALLDEIVRVVTSFRLL